MASVFWSAHNRRLGLLGMLTHISHLACDRFASHSARIGKIAAITLCVWKSA